MLPLLKWLYSKIIKINPCSIWKERDNIRGKKKCLCILYPVNNTLTNEPRKKEAKTREQEDISFKTAGKSARGHLSKQYLRDTKFHAGEIEGTSFMG